MKEYRNRPAKEELTDEQWEAISNAPRTYLKIILEITDPDCAVHPDLDCLMVSELAIEIQHDPQKAPVSDPRTNRVMRVIQAVEKTIMGELIMSNPDTLEDIRREHAQRLNTAAISGELETPRIVDGTLVLPKAKGIN